MTRSNSIARLAIPGGWSEREVVIGSRTFNLLVPADPDEFLNHLEHPAPDAPSHLADPYWAKLWPAAEYLAATVMRAGEFEKASGGREPPGNDAPRVDDRSPGDLTGRLTSPARQLHIGIPLLELGCGSGLVGLAALAAGFEVTFSDYVAAAVDLALENARRNGFLSSKGLVLDWRRPLELQWPLIVAADVTYDRANLPLLLDVLDRMLAPGGEAWFGDAGRGPAEDFLYMAADRGWSVTLLDEHDRPVLAPVLGSYQRFVLRRTTRG